MTAGGDEPAWKQRAVERSLRTAKERAGQRVQKFLDAAQAIIVEKGTTDFTVQEVVDRSKQSLRSFYLQFDGKHELLLALYEDAVSRMSAQIRAATEIHDEPIDKLRVAVELLYQLCQPDPVAQRPLFTEFGAQLLISHPVEVGQAHIALFELFSELLEEAGESGHLRPGADPRRIASMTMQTVMFIAQPATTNSHTQRITAEEVWDFCAHGITR
ncbi:TetR/AcrR family transcriptional regulator [Gordonia sp. ABSL1-1]|uniref:TetR/AcrR family transcriptional regulator n=1 Tax=Gordonia sp. ABSL1-1 TaxID=3053923 RepID=UPI002572360C|nr:TetR/AcrR family transcriptional regulator [Gordonia sp. ABSL1-1]MDL9936209.1 TetR/AcrR family transcriptional regulator [Gordonia sp. ABSL1-1]